MKVYRRVKAKHKILGINPLPTNEVLGDGELWTVDLDQGREFSEKEAIEIVRDFQFLYPEHEYWYSEKYIGVSCWHCQGRHLGIYCPEGGTSY